MNCPTTLNSAIWNADSSDAGKAVAIEDSDSMIITLVSCPRLVMKTVVVSETEILDDSCPTLSTGAKVLVSEPDITRLSDDWVTTDIETTSVIPREPVSLLGINTLTKEDSDIVIEPVVAAERSLVPPVINIVPWSTTVTAPASVADR